MRSLLVLIGGTAAAQIITIIASPILSRVFTAADFGIFSVYAGCVYFFNSFSSFRLETALLTADDKRAGGLIFSSLLFLLLTVLLLIVISAILKEWYFVQQYSLCWLPIGVLFGGFFNIALNYSLRIQRLAGVSVGRFVQSIVGVISQIAIGIVFGGVFGLILGQILGIVAGIVCLIWLGGYLSKFTFRLPALSKEFFWDYKNYIVYDSLGSAMSVAANHLPTILMTIVLGPAMGGAYYMAARILILPLGFVAVATSQYISARFKTWSDGGSLNANIRSAVAFLIAAVMLPLFCVGVYSKELFTFVLGPEWVVAGEVAGWCGVWLGCKFVYDSLSVSLSLASQQKISMIFQASLLSVRVLVIFLGASVFNAIDAIKVFCIVSAGWYFFGILIINSIGCSLRGWKKPTLYMFVSGICALLLYCIKWYLNDRGELLILASILTAMFWLAWVIQEFALIRKVVSEA